MFRIFFLLVFSLIKHTLFSVLCRWRQQLKCWDKMYMKNFQGRQFGRLCEIFFIFPGTLLARHEDWRIIQWPRKFCERTWDYIMEMLRGGLWVVLNRDRPCCKPSIAAGRWIKRAKANVVKWILPWVIHALFVCSKLWPGCIAWHFQTFTIKSIADVWNILKNL